MMKTLDDIIFEMKFGTIDEDVINGAVEHLRDYKDLLLYVNKINGDANHFLEKYLDNKPLTWDELKTMQDKPVYVEQWRFNKKKKETEKSGWWIIAEFVGDKGIGDNEYYFSKEQIGESWNAYIKERK